MCAVFHIMDITQATPENLKGIFPSSPELDILKEQLTYFKLANDELTSSYRALNQSFSSFTGTINTIFVITAASFAAVTGLISFFGIQSSVDALVQKEVGRELSQKLEERFEYLERLAKREGLLDRIEISYYLPDRDAKSLPEFLALCKRFKKVTYVSKIDDQMLKSNIVILDVENSNISVEKRLKRLLKFCLHFRCLKV